jgi:hypothetical protein
MDMMRILKFDGMMKICGNKKLLCRIIVNEKEWAYHREQIHNRPCKSIEPNMMKEISPGKIQLFLKANENLNIPFVYQSYSANNTYPFANELDTPSKPAKIAQVKHC